MRALLMAAVLALAAGSVSAQISTGNLSGTVTDTQGAGRIVGHGTPAEVQASDDPEVLQFIRGEPDGPVKFHYPAAAYGADLGLRP